MRSRRRRTTGHLRIVCVVLLLVALGCGTEGRSGPGVLPSSSHYHAVVATDDGLVLAGHDGLWRSDDGRSWRGIRAPFGHVLGLAVHDGVLWAGGTGLATADGDRWRTVRHDGLVQALGGGDALYAWTLGRGVQVLAGDAPTADATAVPPSGGHTTAPDDGITALAAGRSVLAAVGPNFGALASRDGGRTWADLRAPAPVTAVAVSPDDAVYAGGTGTVWRLAPDGEPSELALDAGGQIAALAVDGDGLWVLVQGGVLYRSDDDGRSFTTAATAP